MLPIPCRTSSLAQSRGGRAIRSQSHPRGLPGNYTATHRASILEGNCIQPGLLRLLCILERHGIVYIVEIFVELFVTQPAFKAYPRARVELYHTPVRFCK